MNILILNDYACVQGGAAQVAISSARGLADAGDNVFFVFSVGPVDAQLIHPNIKLVDLEQYDLLSNPSRANAAIVGIWNHDVERRVSQAIQEAVAEDLVIHVHSWVKSLSVSAINACFSSKYPVVITLHDYFSLCPNGGLYNYQSGQICNVRPMSLSCLISNCDSRNYSNKIWRYVRQLVTKKAGVPDRVKNFIYVTEFSKEIIAPYISRESNLYHVPNPINVEKQNAAEPAKSSTFTFIGRLASEKGVELFAKAALLADVNCRFVGAGELLETLQVINPHAEFTGWKDRSAIIELIKGSRAVVFPSLLYETQGMVVAEAAALGVPCIVSDACAGRDFVVNGVTGVWFESGNLDSFTNAIVLLNKDPILAQKLGRNAYDKFWANDFSLDCHVANLKHCYASILDKWKSS